MATVDRIQQGTAAPIAVSLASGSVPADPSSDQASVAITRADGTVLAAARPAQNGGTGIFTTQLAAADTALLDTLTATWTFTSAGQQQYVRTYHEVVGGFLVSLPALAATLTGVDDDTLRERRTRVEQRLEKALGYACVPRYVLELKPIRSGVIRTRWPLRAVRSLAIGGTPYSLSALDALMLDSAAIGGVSGRGPAVVGYEHGRDFPDADVTEAALLLADEMYGVNAVDQWVVRQEADNMAVQYSTPNTTGTFIGARLNQIIASNALPAIV